MAINNEEKEVTIPEILSGIIAYKNRVQNFKLLKDGIEKKYVDDELDLEDRQQESVLKLIEDTEDGKYKDKGYFHACTAFGKTYLMMAIAESYRHNVKNKKIVIFEENSTVLEQVKKDFIEKTSFLETDIGAYYGKEKTPDAPIIVCTYASMKKLIDEVGRENIGLALCDEAHHILSENRQEVAKYLDHSCLYGFTATPEYDDVKSCAQVFGRVIDSVTLRQGINNGLLCGFKNGLIVSKIPVDLSEALDNSGDYNQEKLKEIFKQSHIHGMREELADFYLKGQDDVLGPIYGKNTMINVPSQEEANLLAEVFNQKAGKTIAKAYHTNSGDAPLEEFNQNKFPVLIQVNRLTEGYSNPNIEVCINYPTSSVVKSAQRSGRALRRNKNNPNKVALIMDIAFKKSNDLDTISAIKANKQVLFSDIAQEFMMLPRDVNIVPSQETGGNAKEKVEINENELFDIITDYENLFEFGFDSALYTESITPKREKLDTDITKEFFAKNTSVIDTLGKVFGGEYKTNLYDALKNEQPNLFTTVKSGHATFSVISAEKREDFRKYLEEKGYTVIFPDEKKEISNTDITKVIFATNMSVINSSGKAVGQGEKRNLYDALKNEQPNLFITVKSGQHIVSVISAEKREDLRKYLKEKGYTVILPDEKKPEREMSNTDITKVIFATKLSVINSLGKAVGLRYGDKSNLYATIENERPDLFIKVKSGKPIITVIPAEKREDLRKYLKEKGYTIIFPDEKKEISNTDITKMIFSQNTSVVNSSGKAVGYRDKSNLYDVIEEKQPDLFTRIKSGSATISIISAEKREDFRNYLKENGYTVIFTDEKIEISNTDITKNIFVKNSSVIDTSGKVVGEGEKRNLYVAIEKEHPNLFVRVKSGNHIISVIPEEKREDFKKHLKEKYGCNVTFPDEKENKTKTTSTLIMPNNGGNEM